MINDERVHTLNRGNFSEQWNHEGCMAFRSLLSSQKSLSRRNFLLDNSDLILNLDLVSYPHFWSRTSINNSDIWCRKEDLVGSRVGNWVNISRYCMVCLYILVMKNIVSPSSNYSGVLHMRWNTAPLHSFFMKSPKTRNSTRIQFLRGDLIRLGKGNWSPRVQDNNLFSVYHLCLWEKIWKPEHERSWMCKKTVVG